MCDFSRGYRVPEGIQTPIWSGISTLCEVSLWFASVVCVFGVARHPTLLLIASYTDMFHSGEHDGYRLEQSDSVDGHARHKTDSAAGSRFIFYAIW